MVTTVHTIKPGTYLMMADADASELGERLVIFTGEIQIDLGEAVMRLGLTWDGSAETELVAFKKILRLPTEDDVMCHSRWIDVVELVKRSGFDLSPCQGCALDIVCVPDGLPFCESCAKENV